mmetsp:Transcript_54462/g.115682  ORF Transcript_54462/g.115682 Transcript_54462/m.115682 type:complete len:108 (+) Transcript_54462:62-385(+)
MNRLAATLAFLAALAMTASASALVISPLLFRLNSWGVGGQRRQTGTAPTRSKTIITPEQHADEKLPFSDICDIEECLRLESEQAKTAKILAAQEVVGSWLPPNIFEN